MNKATAIKKHDRLWQATAEILRAWDPYSLLASGSPGDEFDSEVTAVVAQTPRIQSASDAAYAVSRVFSSSFEPKIFTPEACSDVGARLFQHLKEQGLLS